MNIEREQSKINSRALGTAKLVSQLCQVINGELLKFFLDLMYFESMPWFAGDVTLRKYVRMNN